MRAATSKKLLAAAALAILPWCARSYSLLPRASVLFPIGDRPRLRGPKSEKPAFPLASPPPSADGGYALFSSRAGQHARPEEIRRGRRLKRLVLRTIRRLGLLGAEAPKFRRSAAILCAWATVLLFSASGASAIPSGGRAGGSFGPSHHRLSPPSPISRPGSPDFRGGPLPPPGLYMRPGVADPEEGEELEELSVDLVPHPASPSAKSVRVVDPVTYYAALTGAYALAVRRIHAAGRKRERRRTALGDGASVARVSVALNVPDRDDPGSILARLKDISDGAKTYSRKGVQNMVSEVALELLRQRDAVTSASSTYMHCSGPSQAEIEFNRMSTFERAKFGKETVNNFNGMKSLMGKVSENAEEGVTQATSAVATLLVSIEGDQTKIPTIVSRRDLENALLRIAADSQIDDCLLSAEILWTPEDRLVALSDQDIVSSYPQLVVI